jgi:hypothetical protein
VTARSLTPEAVVEIRRAVAGGEPIAEVARRLGISYRVTADAAYGVTYADITDARPVPRPPRRWVRPTTKLTVGQVAQARRDYPATPLSVLARRAGVRVQTIRSAVHGWTWAHVEDPPPVPLGTSRRRAATAPPAAREHRRTQLLGGRR